VDEKRGNRALDPGDGRRAVEIRKLMDVEDFSEEFTPNPEIAKVKFE
jgi:hypothetical protein